MNESRREEATPVDKAAEGQSEHQPLDPQVTEPEIEMSSAEDGAE